MNAETPTQSARPYLPPLDKLLRYGEPSQLKAAPDYLAEGIGPEHTQELIRMATDEALNQADSDSLEVWAPLHAWRALGQLRAEAAVEPLLTLFKRIEENNDDWVQSDLPSALGEIGPAALPALSAYLADPANELWARVAAADSIKEVGQQHPENRAECVALLTRRMSQFSQNGSTFNGSLVACLLDLEAVEAAPVLEQAFRAGAVDETVAGDWEEVQVELGLLEERTTPRSFPTFSAWGEMSRPGRQGSLLKSGAGADLQALNKARKKARSEAKKAKWKKLQQRQKRK